MVYWRTQAERARQELRECRAAMSAPAIGMQVIRGVLGQVDGLTAEYSTYDQLQELVGMHLRMSKVLARYMTAHPEAAGELNRLYDEVETSDDEPQG